ncbi:biofilm development regulator YmgB/AriR family protein [Vagococcus sp. WN89Y]|uniref:biofilm development regulator YmgB/AriR family protein n=1 Tax=Vagococcus sp. WN89Y TaxID=3457258 RepID=UPI003FCCF1D0
MQTTTTEEQLNAYFGSKAQAYEAEKKVLNDLMHNLRLKQPEVSNKHLILALISLLETEDDVVKLDIYRSALEMVVQKTPDDL